MNSFFYAFYSLLIYSIWSFYVYNVSPTRSMISSTTPYKLAEIIRDTWPNLYRPPIRTYNKVYTPEGYISDPPDAVCPHCGKKQKSCSYVNSVSRAWARESCAKENTSKSPKR